MKIHCMVKGVKQLKILAPGSEGLNEWKRIIASRVVIELYVTRQFSTPGPSQSCLARPSCSVHAQAGAQYVNFEPGKGFKDLCQ